MHTTQPRIIIAALKGGSGKTIFSLGLLAAWRDQGLQVAPFKKGPDFIDAGWLTCAAGRPCHNLDSFMMDKDQILRSFFANSNQADVSVIEGNRGLFDGLDIERRCSTAELAKCLNAPVILIVDVTMATRTVAAVVKGCQIFDPGLNIAGVILNRVAGFRQEALITKSIERYCGIDVVGTVPKLKENCFPERHMGLVPHQERNHAEKAVIWTKRKVQKHLQLDRILKIAKDVEPIGARFQHHELVPVSQVKNDSPRIGFIRDNAFWFYYPENLDQLKRMGADLIQINSISQKALPPLDALYIGGGFPEVQAKALSDNQAFRSSLKTEIDKGLPVYAECGGFMYMGENLLLDGKTYPMVGAVPVDFVLQNKPHGHGYTIMEVVRPNPYYPIGEILKGHEFHYSKAILTKKGQTEFLFKVSRGRGVDGRRDGICRKNLLATYTHLHAAGCPLWAKSLFRAAQNYKNAMNGSKQNAFIKCEKNS